MPDPTFAAISTSLNVGSTDAASGQVTLASVTAGQLVLVLVQRNQYSDITGVTLGSQALTQIKVHTSPSNFSIGVWAGIASSSGTNVVVTASFSTSQAWLSMVAGLWNNVASATPLTSSCDTADCTWYGSSETTRTSLQISPAVRALIAGVGTDYDLYQTHTAQNSYAKRFDNDIGGGGSTSVQWIFDKVADAGNYGGAANFSTTPSADTYMGMLFAFEPTADGGWEPQVDAPEKLITVTPAMAWR